MEIYYAERLPSFGNNKQAICNSLPTTDLGPNVMIWEAGKDGNFSIINAYEYLCNHEDKDVKKLWKAIWQWNGPKKTKIFIWKCFNNGLK